jgi:hypothetical protein
MQSEEGMVSALVEMWLLGCAALLVVSENSTFWVPAVTFMARPRRAWWQTWARACGGGGGQRGCAGGREAGVSGEGEQCDWRVVGEGVLGGGGGDGCLQGLRGKATSVVGGGVEGGGSGGGEAGRGAAGG